MSQSLLGWNFFGLSSNHTSNLLYEYYVLAKILRTQYNEFLTIPTYVRKYLIEKIFNITVTSINTCILPTKTRRVGKFVGKRSVYKKAYVQLKEGDTISDLFN